MLGSCSNWKTQHIPNDTQMSQWRYRKKCPTNMPTGPVRSPEPSAGLGELSSSVSLSPAPTSQPETTGGRSGQMYRSAFSPLSSRIWTQQDHAGLLPVWYLLQACIQMGTERILNLRNSESQDQRALQQGSAACPMPCAYPLVCESSAFITNSLTHSNVLLWPTGQIWPTVCVCQ